MINYNDNLFSIMFGNIETALSAKGVCIGQCTGCMCSCRCSCYNIDSLLFLEL